MPAERRAAEGRAREAAPGILKAGISVADDLRQLEGTFPGLEAHSVLDLGTVARGA